MSKFFFLNFDELICKKINFDLETENCGRDQCYDAIQRKRFCFTIVYENKICFFF